MIEKNIFQTYPDISSLPEEIRINIDQIKLQNVGWNYRIFDDEDVRKYIRKFYPEYLKYYDMINPKYGPARADFFRYLLIYREGGIYIDIKSSLRKPLDMVILDDDEFILSYWPNFEPMTHPELDCKGEYQQWFIVSRSNHPFLKSVINNMVKNIKNYNPIFGSVGKKGVLRLTGPVMYTLSIQPIRELHSHRIADSYNELGFTYSIYDEYNMFTGKHKKLFDKHYSDLKEPIVHNDLSIFDKSFTLTSIKYFKESAYRRLRRMMRNCN
ncbi:glycosyltransferase family 32 protein [Nitratifractor sp.]|uniref:glycosyltransferase family 32 protein n=1 Tax=Nitratifractor sp. TaxID=2268144 RepID=UPI0025CD55CD|nr:glycosyltransferase [Nitratifractor sp.]